MIPKKEFIRRYCEASQITEETLLKHRAVKRCYCGNELCEGWAAMPLDMVEWHMKTDGRPPEQS